MEDRKVVLSKRLKMLADMVTPGNRLADVGCDHGFLSIYLVQNRICPGALAMDVRTGPLEAAKAHVAEAGLGDYIETRLSDGLMACEAGEADTCVCAGMGGPLMEKILTDSMEKLKTLKEMILQPQSEIKEFREFLRSTGFQIVSEDAVVEEGKYYFAMKAVYGTGNIGAEEVPEAEESFCHKRKQQRLFDAYGGYLLLNKHPVLLDYLQQRKEYVEKLQDSLREADSQKAKERLSEVMKELREIQEALSYFSEAHTRGRRRGYGVGRLKDYLD